MNLYLLTRTSRHNYDEYDSAVVVAEDEADAKRIHPSGKDPVTSDPAKAGKWVVIEQVVVDLIGTAKPFMKRGVVCASLNAG